MQEIFILNTYRTVAIVGVSPKEDRDSNKVASYLDQHGYHVIPVNPNTSEVIGKKCYPDLLSIPENVEIVDIFRKSEEVLPIVNEAIKIRAKVIWMQEGIENELAAAEARQAGLIVIMNTCIKKMHENMSET